MKILKSTTISFIVIVILLTLSGCVGNMDESEKNSCIAEVKENIVSIMSGTDITDYTISDDVYYEGGSHYCMQVNIPAFDDLSDEDKLLILNKLTDAGEGYFTNEDDWNMIFVKVVSNGNTYSAYDNYEYYKNGEAVTVNEKPTTENKTSYDSYDDDDFGYSYDKNDSYYSDNDYDNDGKINGEEFQGAVGDFMDSYGY